MEPDEYIDFGENKHLCFAMVDVLNADYKAMLKFVQFMWGDDYNYTVADFTARAEYKDWWPDPAPEERRISGVEKKVKNQLISKFYKISQNLTNDYIGNISTHCGITQGGGPMYTFAQEVRAAKSKLRESAKPYFEAQAIRIIEDKLDTLCFGIEIDDKD
jgi:hypothetical protein